MNLSRMCANRNVFKRLYSSIVTNLKIMDPLQETALKEKCFLVDENDTMIGTASKRDCHFLQPDGHIPLHRAFSVFIFNTRGDLLMQKRSEYKITYPNHYTNTCCSHPIAEVEGEDIEEEALGIKRAAQRRLNYELGIPLEEVDPKNMKYLTRIHYKDNGNGEWGEHEIDYILFINKDVTIKPNPNEVSAICYVPFGKMAELLPELEAPLTPWFKLILKYKLDLWWKNLDNLDKFIDHKKIHKFT